MLTGLLVQAAVRRTPVLFDGVVAAAAALVADQARPGMRRWWQPAQLTGEPAQDVVLRALTASPLLDLGMATGDGSGGLVALGLIRSAFALVGRRAQRTCDSTNGGFVTRTVDGRPRTSSCSS